MEADRLEINIGREAIFAMDPEALAERLHELVSFDDAKGGDLRGEYRSMTEKLMEATAYICYFREMETLARLKKRRARSEKRQPDADRLLGIEEVFEAFRRIAEQQYETLSKTLTARRLMLDEARFTSAQI